MSFKLVLENMRKLNNVMRWSNEFLHRRASVSEHSFCVAQIAQMLGFIEEAEGNAVNWQKLYRKALNHDVPESLVGDVLSTTKNINSEVQENIHKVEKLMVENMTESLLEPYRTLYRETFFDGKDSSHEGVILAAADNIDALIECIEEVKLSNFNPFAEKYLLVLSKIERIPLVSVKFFLEHILPNLTEGLELKAKSA